MCGIAGYLHFSGKSADKSILKGMTDAIAHRGPDGEGLWHEQQVAIGHRRLAIIDPSPNGVQPMLSAEHRYVLSYNGELYNYPELRKELEAKGYWFRSECDTEVVLNALVEWSEKALDKFNGMFALALWDRQKQSLFLARDRYGIKPLYYVSQEDLFAFGSEQKALWAHPDLKRELDTSTLLEYFTFQNIFTHQTFDKDIQLLPAGCYARLDLNTPGNTLQITRFWDYCFKSDSDIKSYDEYQEELDVLMRQAVKRQLVSDVEVGAYLSGGMDSGTLTALAAGHKAYIKSFTCGFDLSSASGIELSFDERRKAEAMSAVFKTEHYEMILKSGDMERCLPRFTHHLEEPRVGQSYPNYYAAQLASKFVKVVLSGTGGDELFGGYPWRYYRAAINKNFEHYIDQYYLFWQRLVPNSELKKVFKPIWQDVQHVWTRDIFRDVFSNHQSELNSPEDYINHSLYFESKTFLHGLLMVEDKLSMAHGLETRVPFLDNDLVDFAMRCPLKYKLSNFDEVMRINENEVGDKISNYYKKTKDGKKILRDVMKRYIPNSVTEDYKQGFSSPDASWFKGESIDFVRSRLLNGHAKLYDYMDKATVTSMVNEHLSGTQNRRLLIWSLINVEEWLAQNY